MTTKPLPPELSAYAAGAAAGAVAMLLVLLPHLRIDLPTGGPRMSPTHVKTLPVPAPSQSPYAAAKIGLPPTD
jgi:hypothetical protein